MAHIEVEGQKVELAEDWRIGELIRAENALDIDMDSAKAAARTALVMYISLARVDPWKDASPGTLADLVMSADIAALVQQEDDAGPPAEAPADESGQSGEAENDGQPTTGALRSVSSG